MNQKLEEENIDYNSQTVAVSLKTKTMNMLKLLSSNYKTKTRRPNGRLGKRKSRKTVRIKNLDAIDFLHNETLLSTASGSSGRKLPPPPGCVDYQFTTLTALAANTVPIHTELPPATHETPYALQVLLDLYREQFLSMIRCMKTDKFKENVESQIIVEKAKKQNLRAKLQQLEKQINLLIGDSLKLLRTRMAELGIMNGYNAKDLMIKAKEIMLRHHELQGEAAQLKHQIPVLEGENLFLQNRNSNEFSAPNVEISSTKLQIPIIQTNNVSEKEILTSDDDVPISEFEIQLKAVDYATKFKSLNKENTSINITPCSIVLPRINGSDFVDGAKLNLLTPAQKKFIYNEPQIVESIQNLPNNALSLNNENKPPLQKHASGHRHHHRSSKKSRKSKKKRKDVDLLLEEKIAGQDQVNRFANTTNFDNITVNKSIKTEPSVTPSYPRIASTVFNDPIEDIITKTLKNDSHIPHMQYNSESRIPSNVISTDTNYLSNNVENEGKTNQSDYRRVPPMKIALKKFAKENEVVQIMSANLIGATVGDLVSNEIEKSLEISNRRTYNSCSVPLDYINDHELKNESYPSEISEQNGGRSNGMHEKKSRFFAPVCVMTSPSHLSSKRSPSYSILITKVKEEPLEGLATSMFNSVNTSRSSEVNSLEPSSPYYTPPRNTELIPNYLFSTSIQSSRSEASFSTDQIEANSNKWQDVSLCFDRMFEFVSTKLDSQENVPRTNKVKYSNEKLSPNFNLNPPPLSREDSSFSDSPIPDLPVSPASLEGPFSPVPSLSPPSLQSPTSSKHAQNCEGQEGHLYCNEEFCPIRRGWTWH